MNKKRKWLMLCSVSLMSVLTFGVPVNAMERAEDENVQKSIEIEPRSQAFEWRYKTVDGIQYKRLWSLTTHEWLTDWIKC